MIIAKQFLKEYKQIKKSCAKTNLDMDRVFILVILLMLIIATIVFSCSAKLVWAIICFLILVVLCICLDYNDRRERNIKSVFERIRQNSDTTFKILKRHSINNLSSIDIILCELDILEKNMSGNSLFKMLWSISFEIVIAAISTILGEGDSIEKTTVIQTLFFATTALVLFSVIQYLRNDFLRTERFLIEEVRAALLLNRASFKE